MLTKYIPELPNLLPEPGTWRPFPTINERSQWTSLPADIRSRLVGRGQDSLDTTWPNLSANLFLEFSRSGNRSNYERFHFERRSRLAELVLAECTEAMGRFLEDIVNGVWAICEESYWGVPAHISIQKAGSGLPDAAEPTVDLFVGETTALLAWTSYLLGERLDVISPLVRPRIQLEIERRVLSPCLERDDFWWMSFNTDGRGVNNWNPWVNSNWLTAVLLLENDPDRQLTAVGKILRSLELFIDTYGEMGGCDEGPGYWGRAAASLFDCLELLYSASGGKLNVYDQLKIQNMGRFIYRTHIHDDYYVNFADASAVNTPPGGLVFRYGQRIQDQPMMEFGAWLMDKARSQGRVHLDSMGRQLPALFALDGLKDITPHQPKTQFAWFDDIQVLTARNQDEREGEIFLAVKGGHNAESHNHNDIGNFIIYTDGKPLIVDAGVETYTRKTFSPQRYEIWTMQSAYHSLLPTIINSDGERMQEPGRSFAARAVKMQQLPHSANLSMDIAEAYPPEAGLEQWTRIVSLHSDHSITVDDQYVLSKPARSMMLSLLTPCEPILVEDGVLELRRASFGEDRQSGQGSVHYPTGLFKITLERLPITDERLGGVWGDGLNRVIFTTKQPSEGGSWQFIFQN